MISASAAAKVFGATVLGSGAAAASGYAYLRNEMGADALNRLVRFDSLLIPCVLEYKLLEFRCERLPALLPSLCAPMTSAEENAAFAPLHEKWARPTRDLFLALGGFYYKTGQKIATNTPGNVPKTYMDEYEVFLDKIPPRPFARVRDLVEANLGAPLSATFSSFDEAPLGCASIGQTHRAVLRATGERVVVKVMNPEAERTFRGDVFAMKSLMAIFLPQFLPAFEEIERQFATEFDYRRECANARAIRANLRRAGFTNCVVPAVHDALCTKEVMVMEEIYPAVPLLRALEDQAAAVAKARGVTTAAFIASERARVAQEEAAAAARGELARGYDATTLDRYARAQRLKARALGWLPWRRRRAGAAAGSDVLVPINTARLVDDLLAVHGHEVLIDGVFNGDPHGGNILYIANPRGGGAPKLGLIDYGQVKYLTEKQRLDTAKSYLLVQAAIRVDPRVDAAAPPRVRARARAAIAAHMTALGVQTEKMLEETFYQFGTVFFGRMDPTWLWPQNLMAWSDELQANDKLVNIDEIDYCVMINTTSMMLRGLGGALQQHRNLADAWAPFARRALAEKGQLEAVEAEIRAWWDPE